MSHSVPKITIAGGIGGANPGAAQLGHFVVKAFLDKKVPVTVIARPASASSALAEELKAKGAKILAVDYADESALTGALQGTDILFSFLTTSAIGAQKPLVQAAAKAGVKLLVPSEYGNVTLGAPTNSPTYPKVEIQQLAKSLNLPYTLIYNGLFAHLAPYIVAPSESGQVEIIGDGEAQLSYTTREDIAGFIAHVFTSNSIQAVSGQVYRIEGSRSNFNTLVKLLEKKNNTTYKVNYVPAEQGTERWLQKGDVIAGLKAEWAQGRALVAADTSELSNKLWPGHSWTPVDTFFK